MASSKWLSSLKASQLKHVAFLTGLPTTGTKAELQTLIQDCVLRRVTAPATGRIVSIDMGIKNLAICVLESPEDRPGSAGPGSMVRSPLNVVAWKKVDVLTQLPLGARKDTKEATTDESEAMTKSRSKVSKAPKVNAAVFAPSILSEAAVSIIRDIQYDYHPAHILIERQRFRSGGASAVQEWTLRVNMLESMLWACLKATQDQSRRLNGAGHVSEAWEVSPARVANFWCARPAAMPTIVQENMFEERKKDPLPKGTKTIEGVRKKVTKQDKIALARSWLSLHKGKKAGGEDVVLEFEGDSQAVADSFLADTKVGRKSKGDINGHGPAKLDDLADCLLQAVAWTRWQDNRQLIRNQVISRAEENRE